MISIPKTIVKMPPVSIIPISVSISFNPVPTIKSLIATFSLLCFSASIFWLPTSNIVTTSFIALTEHFFECNSVVKCAFGVVAGN